MTFPTVESTNSGTTAGAATHVINMPAGIQAGDLLLLFFGTDSSNSISNWDGFTELGSESNGTANFFAIGYKIAVGSDTCTLTVTDTNEPGAHVIYRISGHDSGQIPELSTVAEAATNTPNPTGVTPTGGAKDYLWILAAGWDRDRSISAWNANFTLNRLFESSGGSGGTCVGVSARKENVDSKDPGSMTISSADTWIAWTVAVHPEAGPATYDVTKNSNARIKRLGLSVIKTTDARILIVQSVSKTSDARIVSTKTVTKDVDTRIIGTDSVTKSADGRIRREGLSVTKTSDAKIVITKTVDKTVDARIIGTETVTKSSDARMFSEDLTVIKTVNARIVLTNTVAKTSDGRIKTEGLTVTKTVDAKILVEQSVTKTSDGRIVATKTVTKTSEVRILVVKTVTKSVDARIFREGLLVTKTCDAKIVGGFETKEVTKTSDGRIFKEGISVTKTSDGRIFKTSQVTKTVDAKIKLVVDITKPSDARIFRSVQVSKSSDARIAASLMGVKVLKTCDAIIMPPDWPFSQGVYRGRDNSEGEVFRGRDPYETTELRSRLKR